MPGSSTSPLKVKKVRSSAVCAEAGVFPSPASNVPAQISPQILLPTLLLSMKSSFRPCERCHIAASSIQTRLTPDKFRGARTTRHQYPVGGFDVRGAVLILPTIDGGIEQW